MTPKITRRQATSVSVSVLVLVTAYLRVVQMAMKGDGSNSERFGIIDILRIVGGLLFLNALLSYWFTSSSTWGYDGKWLEPRFIALIVTQGYKTLTIDELSLYNGTDPSLPILIGVNGKVYDVTRSGHIYGKNGPYNFFSGKDAARAFSTGCFNKPDEFTYDLRGLDMDEALKDISHWQRFFENSQKYWYVGEVTHDPIIGEPPAPCEHMKFPGRHS